MFINFRFLMTIFASLALITLLGYAGISWAVEPTAGGSIVLAHCGDYVEFWVDGTGGTITMDIENLAKKNNSRVRVGITNGTSQCNTDFKGAGKTKSYDVSGKLNITVADPPGCQTKVKVRLLEKGTGGPCRSQVGESDCQSAPVSDSDVRVYIPKVANSITRCHIESATSCTSCGASFVPQAQ